MAYSEYQLQQIEILLNEVSRHCCGKRYRNRAIDILLTPEQRSITLMPGQIWEDTQGKQWRLETPDAQGIWGMLHEKSMRSVFESESVIKMWWKKIS